MLQLPSLSYEYDALEPHFDARTMEIHHTKHHAGYTNKLQAALQALGADASLTIETILDTYATTSIAVRNNGG